MFQLLRISYHSANGLNKQRCAQRSGLRREGLTYKDAITEVVAPDWCLRGGGNTEGHRSRALLVWKRVMD